MQKLSFLRNTVENVYRLQRRMNASILSLRGTCETDPSANRLQRTSVLPKWQRWIRCVDTRGLDRVLAMSLTQNTDWAQLLSTLSTCSLTVRVLVTVTPRIFILSTRLIWSVQQVTELNVSDDCSQIRFPVTSCDLILGCWLLTTVQCYEFHLAYRYGICWNDWVSIISINLMRVLLPRLLVEPWRLRELTQR